MLKKVLIITSFVALSTTLSSCSYINKSINKFRDTECDTPICEDQRDESEVRAAPVEEITHRHHRSESTSVTTVSEDGLKEITCTETTYTSKANKVQTLGYIPADSCLPELKANYTPVVHKKVRKQPTVKKPKPVKVDSYNKVTETTVQPAPAVEEAPQTAPAPVSTEERHATPVAPTEPQPMSNLQSSAPAQMTTPPAPVPAPVTMPQAPITPATPPTGSDIPVTTPQPSVPATTPADVNNSGANTPYGGQANHQQPTAAPMSNEQAPANSTVSIGRLATLDYSESQVDIPSTGTSTLDQIADDLKRNPGKNVKIQSYAFSKDGNATEARRNSLQRAIKVRKYLIDKDVSASRISVNAIEDINNKLNKVEISFEEAKQ